MSIRGAASLSASNEPLYVVDGIPILNSNASLIQYGGRFELDGSIESDGHRIY